MTNKKETKTKEKTAPHRQWLYKGDDAKLFEKGETIPAGYTDKPKADK